MIVIMMMIGIVTMVVVVVVGLVMRLVAVVGVVRNGRVILVAGNPTLGVYTSTALYTRLVGGVVEIKPSKNFESFGTWFAHLTSTLNNATLQ
jgi:hypothetical protein